MRTARKHKMVINKSTTFINFELFMALKYFFGIISKNIRINYHKPFLTSLYPGLVSNIPAGIFCRSIFVICIFISLIDFDLEKNKNLLRLIEPVI